MEKENHRLKSTFKTGYVSSLEGIIPCHHYTPTFLHQKSRLEIWEVLTNDEQPCWVIFDAGKNHLKEGVLFNPTSGTGARFSSILNKRFISKSVFTCSMIILGLTPNVFGKALARQCGWKLDGNALNSSHQKVQNSACAIHLKDTPDP